MEGMVKMTSYDRQRVAALTDYGYTIFDIESGQVALGDVLSGKLDDHGEQKLVNKTSGKTLVVCIEAIQAPEPTAKSMLREK